MAHEEDANGGKVATPDELRARAARVLSDTPSGMIPEPLTKSAEEREAAERSRLAFTGALRGMKEMLGIPDGAQVVYPGSEEDKTVAEVFGSDHVMHVDPVPDFMDHMRAAGYHTSTEPIEDHRPESPYDVLIARSSYGKPSRGLLARLVRPGGYIIANNYTHWADDVLKCGVPLEGALLPGYDNPDARYVSSPDELAGATEQVAQSYTLAGRQFTDYEWSNPDGLFVFRMPYES